MKTIPVERLRELLHFIDGELIWKVGRQGHIRAGDKAGSLKPNGYMRVVVDQQRLWMHRVVWAMSTGNWPAEQIDHINGIRDDNRIENLREVSRELNQQNQRSERRSKSGLLGVGVNGNRFAARIHIGENQMHIGSFRTPEEAHAAYVAVKREIHPGCTI